MTLHIQDVKSSRKKLDDNNDVFTFTVNGRKIMATVTSSADALKLAVKTILERNTDDLSDYERAMLCVLAKLPISNHGDIAITQEQSP